MLLPGNGSPLRRPIRSLVKVTYLLPLSGLVNPHTKNKRWNYDVVHGNNIYDYKYDTWYVKFKDPVGEWQEAITDVKALFNFFMKVSRNPMIKVCITFNDVCQKAG